MLLEELKPLPIHFSIDGESYQMKEFTLAIMVECIGLFGSLEYLEKVINYNNYDDGMVDGVFKNHISELAWLLLIDKESFPNVCKFKSIFVKNRGKDYQYFENVNCIYQIIERSKPLLDSIEESDRKLINKKEKSSSDFDELYTFIVEKVKYTIDEFYDLTLRQVMVIRKGLLKLERERIKLYAKMHGIEFKESKPISFTKEEDELIRNFANDDFKKMMEGSKQNGKSNNNTQGEKV